MGWSALPVLVAALALVAYPTFGMPLPWTRSLFLANPPLVGQDIYVLHNLILRSPDVTTKLDPLSFTFNVATKMAVREYQASKGLSVDGIFGPLTADSLLQNHLSDGYKDNGTVPSGYMYKVHIPVHMWDRAVQTNATLYAANGTSLLRFVLAQKPGCNGLTRYATRGQSLPSGQQLNQLSGNGATPTGLMEFDLNSPEDDPVDYGPYPVNRAVQGLEGNAKFAIVNNATLAVRRGILMHTGDWKGWKPPQPMPNSHGCIHAWPEDIKRVWEILVSMGVQVRENTGGKLPYPYKPQGLLSIEAI